MSERHPSDDAQDLVALLDGELEPGVLADAHHAGVDLLPGAGEVRPRCSCPEWADPCKHARALRIICAAFPLTLGGTAEANHPNRKEPS